MKNKILFLTLQLVLGSVAFTQQCFDFNQYTTQGLNTTVSTQQTGDIVAQQGDISLIYGVVPNLYIDVVDGVNNELTYNSGGYPSGISIDVSGMQDTCRILTFTALLSDIIVDGDTLINNGVFPYSFDNNTVGYTVSISAIGEYIISGHFDIVTPYLQTNIISNICIEACSVPNNCFDFGVYTNQEIDSISYVSSPGDVVLSQGDIDLIYGDVSFVSLLYVNAGSNELGYTSGGESGGIKIDISNSSYSCKKLTFIGFYGDIIVDNDTLITNNVFPFVYQGNGYSVNVQTDGYTTVQGDFDVVIPYVQTNVISDICLEDCSVPANCFDFGMYTNQEVDSISLASSPGDVLLQQGDISLIYGNVIYMSILNVNAGINQISYTSGAENGGINIDVSNSNFGCKKLTFTSFYENIIVDNDTLLINNVFPFIYQGNGYSVNIQSDGSTTIQGDFDIVTPYVQTNNLSNLCLEDCSLNFINEIKQISSEIVVYPNPVQSENIFVKGNITEFTTYSVYSILGEHIQTGVFNSKSINIENLTKGQYIITFSNDVSILETKSFVKM